MEHLHTPTARADAVVPTSHPFARHLRDVAERSRAGAHAPWTPDDGAMPTLYLSHGAPPTFEDEAWMAQLHGWARDLPRPRAILIVSAHWESDELGITSTAPTELVYDFGGFSPLYFAMRYDTPDNTALASRLLSVLPDTQRVFEHRTRGLDHGAWVPLKVMYPEADIPVLQVSLPTHDPAALFAFGQRLQALRSEGVLVIGSGFMTHGLRHIDWSRPGVVPSWSSDFDAWVADALSRGDVAELQDFQRRAPGLQYAHPTAEHFTPLFVTLGAATDPTAGVTTAIDGFTMGLAKRSFQAA
jgi:4,5-DOPA dioxygenase extradiol